MAEDSTEFERLKAEQERLWAEIEAKPAPEGYDAWFREQVEVGLREAADPKTVWTVQEDVERETELQIQRWHERERKSA